MFSRQLTDRIRLSLSVQAHAEEIFVLTDRNRSFLRQWLPWLDMTTGVDDTRAFLERQLYGFAKGDSLTATIFYDGKAAGVAGFNSIDRTNGIGSIGYWLAEEFNGKGIMTRVVEDLIEIGREIIPCRRSRSVVHRRTSAAGRFRGGSDFNTKAPCAVWRGSMTAGTITRFTQCYCEGAGDAISWCLVRTAGEILQ